LAVQLFYPDGQICGFVTVQRLHVCRWTQEGALKDKEGRAGIRATPSEKLEDNVARGRGKEMENSRQKIQKLGDTPRRSCAKPINSRYVEEASRQGVANTNVVCCDKRPLHSIAADDRVPSFPQTYNHISARTRQTHTCILDGIWRTSRPSYRAGRRGTS